MVVPQHSEDTEDGQGQDMFCPLSKHSNLCTRILETEMNLARFMIGFFAILLCALIGLGLGLLLYKVFPHAW